MRTLFILSLLLPGKMWPCIIVFPSVETGPNFRVAIKDRGRAVEGLRLQLGKRTAVTDRDGIAEFRDIPLGSYSLSTENDDGIGLGENIEVKRGGPAGVTIAMTWPTVAPIPAQSLKGIVLYRSGRPIAADGISIDLLAGISGKKLQSVRGSDARAFNFDSVRPGLYFLRVNPDDFAGAGLIAIEIEPNAAADHLELDLSWSDCGLIYSDRSQCGHGELHLDQLRGRVSDVNGAAIEGAQISLFDAAGKTIQMLRSDREGNFASTLNAGRYELVIHSAGFTPFREQVTINPAQDGAPRSSLVVSMGIAGSCTLATAQ